jgi:hypothetical protein
MFCIFVEICNFLTNFLDLWLKYILLNRIKLGKQKQHAKLDIQPAPYVEECRVSTKNSFKSIKYYVLVHAFHNVRHKTL